MADPSAAGPEQLAAAFPELQIEACVGRGGMGVVWRVRQKKLDRLAALKLLSSELAHDTGFAARFEREARALARLDHEGIVRVYDFGVTAGQPWLLMEFVDGVDLRSVLRERTLGPAEAMALVGQACSALACAHAAGVVHRDIKPENLILERRGRVKVIDFGLSKLGDGADARLTLSAQGLGTFRYVAPEQAERAADVDARADVYSLGVVLYELLAGTVPVGRFDPPSRMRAGVDVRCDEIVLRALAPDRERRFRDAAEMRAAIARVTGGAPADREALGPGSGTLRLAFVGLGLALLAVSLLRWSVHDANLHRPDLATENLWQRRYLPGGWFQVPGWLPALAGHAAAAMAGLRATADRTARAVMWVLVVGAAAVVIEVFDPHYELADSDTVVPPLGWFVLCGAIPVLEAFDRRVRVQPALAARLEAPVWRAALPLAPVVFALLVTAASWLER